MKRRLFFTLVAFIAMTVVVSAQTTDNTPGQTGRGRAAGNTFVDADKDGVCDNYQNGTRPGRRPYSAGKNQAAANRGPGKGMGLAQGSRQGAGRSVGMKVGRGAGRAQGIAPGRGRYAGRGPAFVDANKDGICDNIQTTAEKK